MSRPGVGRSGVAPDWTPADEVALRQFWAEKLTGTQIGQRLGRTKNGVLGKAKRLGLPPRPSPLPPAKAEPVAGKPERRKAAQGEGGSVGPLTRGWEKGGRVTGCQWIEGPAVGGARCGAGVLPGTAWCAEHRARVYLPVEKPAQRKEG